MDGWEWIIKENNWRHDFGLVDEVIFAHGALLHHFDGHFDFGPPLAPAHHPELAGSELFQKRQLRRINLPLVVAQSGGGGNWSVSARRHFQATRQPATVVPAKQNKTKQNQIKSHRLLWLIESYYQQAPSSFPAPHSPVIIHQLADGRTAVLLRQEEFQFAVLLDVVMFHLRCRSKIIQ